MNDPGLDDPIAEDAKDVDVVHQKKDEKEEKEEKEEDKQAFLKPMPLVVRQHRISPHNRDIRVYSLSIQHLCSSCAWRVEIPPGGPSRAPIEPSNSFVPNLYI
ncbi:hypothetical protein BGZ57DRAFT_858573 [Hyaloscypha finlandica]|nr:hypothetical protein BGZ57DRAFT_858573 [Hyaloscypha finlandica]